jgi:hypothetical protein
MAQDGNVVDLRTRSGFKPDVASLAREQVAAAREALGASPEEFAAILAPLLGWEPSPEAVESWETTAVPPGDLLLAASLAARGTGHETINPSSDPIGRLISNRFGDLAAVFLSRSAFVADTSSEKLFAGASEIRAAGLSLNLLIQQYGDQCLRDQIEAGTSVRCLFLDPSGDAMRAREVEEGYLPGQLATLTELNIQILTKRVGDQLSGDARERLLVAVYDEPIRFNITIIDEALCVVQPYLPTSRGVETPTFVIHRQPAHAGLFAVFEQTFSGLWERARPI